MKALKIRRFSVFVKISPWEWTLLTLINWSQLSLMVVAFWVEYWSVMVRLQNGVSKILTDSDFWERTVTRLMTLKQGWYRAQNDVRYPQTSEPNYGDGLKTTMKMAKTKKSSNITLQVSRQDGQRTDRAHRQRLWHMDSKAGKDKRGGGYGYSSEGTLSVSWSDKRTTPGIPTWSPTVVLTGPDDA